MFKDHPLQPRSHGAAHAIKTGMVPVLLELVFL